MYFLFRRIRQHIAFLPIFLASLSIGDLLWAMDPSDSISQFELKNLEASFAEACTLGHQFINLKMPQGSVRARIRQSVEALRDNSGRVFNWSVGTLDDQYIIAARVLYTEFPRPIVPGNNAESKFERGENFWWMDWCSPDIIGATLYFQCDKNFENFKLLLPSEFSNGKLHIISPEIIFDSDARMMNFNDRLYYYNPKANNIAREVVCVAGEDHCSFMVFSDKPIANSYMGNNYAMIQLLPEFHLYLDWFYKEGVKCRAFNNGKEVARKIFAYSNTDFPLIGTGSCLNDAYDAGKNTGIMPLFSFGTPHVQLDGMFMGVGHIKIHSDEENFSYEKDSNIDMFRKNLYRDFKRYYGDKYIRHDAFSSKNNERKGYSYLMYFYTVKFGEDGEMATMNISDSYLPIHLSDDFTKYKFSLIFPMGVTSSENAETLYVSAGYGDFYSVLMMFNAQEVKMLCKHDVQNLDLHHYQYKILATDNQGIVRIANSLSEIKDKL